MKAEYVDHLGTDLTVANAARVSFNKHKETIDEADAKLIRYLAAHNHWTPFGHPTVTLRMSAPVFVRTQLFKHKVGFVENEVSRRYVDDQPAFYAPDYWRARPTDGAKQGSSNEVIELPPEWYRDYLRNAAEYYDMLIINGVAPEQARMVLPQSMMTEWYWTGSLMAYARVCKLRLDPHAQKETRDIAMMIDEIIKPLFPISWEALRG